MHTEIHWIPDVSTPGKLAVMARPRGEDWLADEVAHIKSNGINTVVSLLEDQEIHELALSAESSLCQDSDISYKSFPIPDYSVPKSPNAVKGLCKELASELQAGRNVAIHCRQGIGRSGIIAAGILTYCGVPVEQALSKVSIARGCNVPETTEQLQYVLMHFGGVA
jgi:protein-tyrosine phosphatase